MKLIAHPFDNYRLGDFLLKGLESDAIGFVGAVAFAQRSGVGYLAAALNKFSTLHPFQLTIGIDLLGTSKEALELLLKSASVRARLFIFHNPNATFHPKAFRFEYQDRWEVYVGSGNLTRGGLFGNYEAGIAASLSKAIQDDKAFNERFDAEFARWSDVGSGTAKELSAPLIKQLADRKLVVTEQVIKATRSAARKVAGVSSTDEPLFTSSPVPSAPPQPAVAKAAGAEQGEPAVGGAGATPAQSTTTFVMTLEPSDAADTPGRSPEFFVPKLARDMRPQFWGWPDEFISKGVAMNRYNAPFRFEGTEQPVTLFGYADRSEFRIRSRAMRDAAHIGDILRIRHNESDPNATYEVDIVAKGSEEHAGLQGRLTEKAHSSPRRYGYY